MGNTAVWASRMALRHNSAVNMARWSEWGARVLTCSMDHTAILWDQPVWKRLWQVTHEGPIWSASFSKLPEDEAQRSVLTTSADSTAKIWDQPTGHWLTTLGGPGSQGHTGHVVRGDWNAKDNNIVVTCSMDRTARIWDRREDGHRPTNTLEHHTACVWSAKWDRQGELLLTCSHDMTARIYDRRCGYKQKHTLIGHRGMIWYADFADFSSAQDADFADFERAQEADFADFFELCYHVLRGPHGAHLGHLH
eukprot:NODE_1743_length_1070_cov_492.674877.p1 GENE.NODE_1743_length_1070_cov_492.674877~~NODE_1743_length_1070_cov_492.674877.p1  ORF type:complete len:251 (-),score=42.26 NODE_1743_length_1070_cov_492.674877:300-1052(-)